MNRVLFFGILILNLVFSAFSLQPAEDDVLVRVIDTGPGLACVVKMPGGHYMIYDTGHWDRDTDTLAAVQEIVPADETIDLMVLSHSDSDHLGATDEICDSYPVARFLRTGFVRDRQTWRDSDAAVRAEVVADGALDLNLGDVEFPPGATYRFGDTFVTMVFGLHEARDEWDDDLSDSEMRNASSIVIRLVYKGKSVLFCGDTVGRTIRGARHECLAAEKEMIENSSAIPIDSDVLIAPHHGADNGSSMDFIRAVEPRYVVFSAGHSHDHPRRSTGERYLCYGIDPEDIFRTDRGDDEGPMEWNYLRRHNHRDSWGDDTVDILLKGTGEIEVAYLNDDPEDP